MQNTKERILDITAELFRRHGYTGTGLKQIVANANAPFGSLYHHFPGGKEQLGEAVIRRSGQMYEDLVMAVYEAGPDPVSGIAGVFNGAAAVLQATDFADACPIATVALEVASSNEPLRQATDDVFNSWIDAATARFTAAGIEDVRARELAILMIMALEGAFVLARAMKSTEPLAVAGAALTNAMREALPPPRRRAASAGSRPASPGKRSKPA